MQVGENDKIKSFAFVDCLPEAEQRRAKQLIVYNGMNFDALSKEFIDANKGILPRWYHEKNWRNCWPKSRNFREMLCWWTDWNRLAKKVGNITATHMVEQFDMIMIKHYESYM